MRTTGVVDPDLTDEGVPAKELEGMGEASRAIDDSRRDGEDARTGEPAICRGCEEAPPSSFWAISSGVDKDVNVRRKIGSRGDKS